MEFLLDPLEEYGPWGMFVAAFLAATILPLGSEAILTALLASGLDPWPLILIASVGNTLGSVTNYLLGYWLSQSRVQAWLGISDQSFAKAQSRFQRFGMPSLLLAWLPIVGDPLTLVAGVLRVNPVWFVALVGLGKFVRYCAVGYFWL